MTRLLATFVVAIALSSSCFADFVTVDDFAEPISGAHNSDGSAVFLNSPPNFFALRTLDGTAKSNISVTSGGMSASLVRNETAFIEWSLPSDYLAFDNLEFDTFDEVGLIGVTYTVDLGGTQIGSGNFTSALLETDAATILPGDTLRLTFETGAAGFALFSANGIAVAAVPEPSSFMIISLIGVGIATVRRRA